MLSLSMGRPAAWASAREVDFEDNSARFPAW
jgi:hypothetical protein